MSIDWVNAISALITAAITVISVYVILVERIQVGQNGRGVLMQNYLISRNLCKI